MRMAALLLAGALAAPASADTLGPSLSGDARMGLVWSDQPDWAGQRETGLRLTSRARLKLRFEGETTGGLRFGAQFRLDERSERPRAPSVFLGGS